MRRMLPVLALAAIRILVAGTSLTAQTAGSGAVDRNTVFTNEEFRRGVQAYNRFTFNEAILSFEKALSYKNTEPLILEWLGRAYYRSGLEDTALRQWQTARSLYESTSENALLLFGMIETIRNRRSLFPDLDEFARYVEAGRYPGTNEELILYRQPSSVLPQADGSTWVVAYGSNEILRIDPNGIIRARLRGPINGFDRPYDLARGPDGRMYVSEYRGGRVSVLDAQGRWLSYLGSKGRSDGQFVGPQNLSVDEDGYLYVVDFGNRRISKFSPDGAFLFSFGTATTVFPGFRSPTGIAARRDEVFIADGLARRIYRFDQNGNYLGILLDSGLNGPEGLRFTVDGRLLVADTNRILLVDAASTLVRELGGLGKGAVRILCADTDANGNILAANFEAGEISVMARMDDIAAGFFVQIERVVTDKFPEITLDLRVQDRRRRPVVGLDERNFMLSEKGAPVSEQSFMGAAYLSRETDISILVERSPETKALIQDLAVAVKDSAAAADRLISLVSAGEQPVKERFSGTAGLASAAKGNPALYSPGWKFDLGLRLAATDLLPGNQKRAVVFIGSGRLGERAFGRYGISELASYLANNGIVFYAVIAGAETAGAVDRELQYLCDQTGGEVLPLYRSEGVGVVLRRLQDVPTGSYTLRYRSQLPTNFGRAYLPVEAEVYLLERSGRDATGYFALLE